MLRRSITCENENDEFAEKRYNKINEFGKGVELPVSGLLIVLLERCNLIFHFVRNISIIS